MIEIEWFTFAVENHVPPEFVLAKETIALPLTPVFPELIKEYNVRQAHTRCPAFIDTLSNTFLLRSDINIGLRFDPVSRSLDVKDNTELTTSMYIDNRDKDNYNEGNNIFEKGNMTFSIKQHHIFLSEEDVEVELLPCFYHESDFTRKTQLIAGKFNINKWIRPTEVAAMVRNTSYKYKQPVDISIKRGDPLMYIRFITANNKPVKLKQLTDPDKIKKYSEYSHRCVSIKNVLPGLSMQKMYDIFKPFRPKVKKCPFNWKNNG
jgi:hypothetical protein